MGGPASRLGRGGRALALSFGIALIGLFGPSTAAAATELGETFAPDGCGSGTYMQSTSPPGDTYTAPFSGVITSWSYQGSVAAGLPSAVQLKVGRTTPNPFQVLFVAQSDPEIPGAGLNTYATRVSIQAGDFIGIRISTPGGCQRGVSGTVTGYTGATFSGDPQPGSAVFADSAGSGLQYEISAALEPDADNDGFGDETQDQCPTDASKQNECVAPETTITKGPKDKTRKKTATFEFSSNEAGSSFQCALDGRQEFKPCASPLTIKVKKGKHSFSVQAVDAAGNPDGSPATDDWKVKKKKKK
jgi:hypothetical protein